MLMDLFFAAVPNEEEAPRPLPRVHGRDARRDRRVPPVRARPGRCRPHRGGDQADRRRHAAPLPRRVPGPGHHQRDAARPAVRKAVRGRRDAGRDLEHAARRPLSRRPQPPAVPARSSRCSRQHAEIVRLDGADRLPAAEVRGPGGLPLRHRPRGQGRDGRALAPPHRRRARRARRDREPRPQDPRAARRDGRGPLPLRRPLRKAARRPRLSPPRPRLRHPR